MSLPTDSPQVRAAAGAGAGTAAGSPASPGSTAVTEPTHGRSGHRGPGWFDHPALSAGLAASWLLLHQTLAPAQVITAVVLGLGLPRLLHRFMAPPGRIAWGPVPALVLRVLLDIVVANFSVAKLVLSPRMPLKPGWLDLPMQLTHPTAMVLLAAIITTTPGTVSCRVDERRRRILVHALDLSDPKALAAEIHQRYEAPLKAIFEPC